MVPDDELPPGSKSRHHSQLNVNGTLGKDQASPYPQLQTPLDAQGPLSGQGRRVGQPKTQGNAPRSDPKEKKHGLWCIVKRKCLIPRMGHLLLMWSLSTYTQKNFTSENIESDPSSNPPILIGDWVCSWVDEIRLLQPHLFRHWHPHLSSILCMLSVRPSISSSASGRCEKPFPTLPQRYGILQALRHLAKRVFHASSAPSIIVWMIAFPAGSSLHRLMKLTTKTPLSSLFPQIIL